MKHRSRTIRMAYMIASGLAAPSLLTAQAICSAPHSSPTLTQAGSLRTLPAGGGWVQVAGYGQRADEFFNPNGNRQLFLADSEFLTRSVFVTGAIGVYTGIEFWAQVPLHTLTVESAGGNSKTSGIGDVRLAARLGPELVGADLPLSLRFGAKIPGSEFPVDATVLPLTEGQRDWEVSLESGYRIPDRSLYLMGWIGYRLREENEDAARDPGDEVFASLAMGGELRSFSLDVTADLLWGGTPTAQGFELPGDRRRLFQILPTVGRKVGPGRLEFSGQIPLSGQNLPVGVGMSLGYRWSWGLDPIPVADLRDFFGGAGGP